jgi:hypothetical protein
LNLFLVYNFIVEKGEGKATPKWRGLSFDKVRTASESDRDKYFVGCKVWETWLETKKYIQNVINPNWQEPNTLKSGYNITSLLVYVRESCGFHEEAILSKDIIRNARSRHEVVSGFLIAGYFFGFWCCFTESCCFIMDTKTS